MLEVDENQRRKALEKRAREDGEIQIYAREFLHNDTNEPVEAWAEILGKPQRFHKRIQVNNVEPGETIDLAMDVELEHNVCVKYVIPQVPMPTQIVCKLNGHIPPRYTNYYMGNDLNARRWPQTHRLKVTVYVTDVIGEKVLPVYEGEPWGEDLPHTASFGNNTFYLPPHRGMPWEHRQSWYGSDDSDDYQYSDDLSSDHQNSNRVDYFSTSLSYLVPFVLVWSGCKQVLTRREVQDPLMR